MWPWLAPALAAPFAASSLPIYELDRTNVLTAGAWIRPFDPARGFINDPRCPPSPTPPSKLAFSAWRLAHAIVKADFLRWLPLAAVSQLGVFIDLLPILDWRASELRLRAGVAGALADFSGTSLAGRVGQGIALLFAEDRGFPFAGHYPRMSGLPGPDFVVEGDSSPSRVLIEAKGAFVRPNDSPKIKGVLKEGLGQLSSASSQTAANSFAASKSYVVGTFLRERGDNSHEPSMIAYVDPDFDETRPEDGRSDRVRRSNFSAWLDAMGLHDAASDLRSYAATHTRAPLVARVVEIGGVEYGVRALSPVWRDGEPITTGPGGYLVAGLALPQLRAVRTCLRGPGLLLEGQWPESQQPGDAGDNGGFEGSVLGDGTVLGVLSEERYRSAMDEEFGP